VVTVRRSAPLSRPAAAGATPRCVAEEGFTLIGLMVLIAVINIGLAVAMTSWVTVGKRAKEAELIWRGQQYVRAIQCHRQQEGGPPDSLDELLESDCIRALYPDPMTPGGEWRVIRESDLQNELRGGGQTGRGAADMLEDIEREVRGPEAFFGDTGGGGRFLEPGGGLSLGAGRGGGRGGLASGSLRAAFDRFNRLGERLRQDFGGSGSGDGIVGVVSRSTDEALRLFEGESSYDRWRFLAR
jgi:type II secretory pathway pseudopilin PulG